MSQVGIYKLVFVFHVHLASLTEQLIVKAVVKIADYVYLIIKSVGCNCKSIITVIAYLLVWQQATNQLITKNPTACELYHITYLP